MLSIHLGKMTFSPGTRIISSEEGHKNSGSKSLLTNEYFTDHIVSCYGLLIEQEGL
jgi:hypothetical protein